MATILALDVGEKKIGLAVGDTDTRLAFPRPALLVDTWDASWTPLARLIKELNVSGLVIGLPLNDDGTTGPQAERTKEFITEAQRRFGLPIISRDERHSSQAVQREQQAANRKLKRGEEDSLAAQLLLEEYLQTV